MLLLLLHCLPMYLPFKLEDCMETIENVISMMETSTSALRDIEFWNQLCPIMDAPPNDDADDDDIYVYIYNEKSLIIFVLIYCTRRANKTAPLYTVFFASFFKLVSHFCFKFEYRQLEL